MKIRTVAAAILFVFNPLVGGVASFINICRKDVSNGDIIIIAMFFFLLGYSTPPVYDLYRHYNDFNNIVDLNTFLNLIQRKFDLTLYLTEFIIRELGLHFAVIPGLYLFISYIIIFSLYKYYVYRIPKQNAITYFLLTLSVLLSVPVFTIALGLRFGFGCFLALYAIFQIYEKNNIRGYIFLLLAVVSHYAFLLTIIAIICVKLLNLNRLQFLILIVIAISCSYIVSDVILVLPLPELFKSRLLAYLTGYWATEFLNTYSIWYRVSLFLTYWMIYPGILYVILSKDTFRKDKLTKLTVFSIVLLLFFYNYEVIFSRYALFVNLLILFQFVKFYSLDILKSIFLIVMVLFSAITFICGNIYANRTVIELNNMIDVLYLPPLVTIIERSSYKSEVLNKIDAEGRFL
ncbi:hypothetical protein VEGS18_A16040 [Escherichia coli]|uniref:EpsG family protein n=1 Tax=Escherichia coli TaxID=562 RepID=UPI000DD9A912|nr:EpsG family protein [Escherichia coli]BDD23949.1 hypothetical protein VEGS18_A16040 [Escherichia coli]HAW1115512.1 hypothetical protein [Escherichia coli]HCJ8297120.1 EpsG family protein [Escherichia coli]HDP9522931.1 EpsG family protein [Escherichia coli]